MSFLSSGFAKVRYGVIISIFVLLAACEVFGPSVGSLATRSSESGVSGNGTQSVSLTTPLASTSSPIIASANNEVLAYLSTARTDLYLTDPDTEGWNACLTCQIPGSLFATNRCPP